MATLDGSDGFVVSDGATNSLFGWAANAAGDFNGDGFDDVIITARGYGDGERDKAVLIFGAPLHPGFIAVSDLNGQNGVVLDLVGEQQSITEYASGVGDFNGDGLDDVAVATNVETYVVFGRSSTPPVIDLSTLNTNTGMTILARPKRVSGAGDLNNDGIDDIVLADVSVAGVVVYGRRNPQAELNIQNSPIRESDGYLLGGVDQGLSVIAGRAAGDINADGIDDLAIGALQATNDVSRVFVVYGRPGTRSNVALDGLDGSEGFSVMSTQSNLLSIAGIGDMNADSIDDLIVSGGKTAVIFGHSGAFPASVAIETLQGDDGFLIEGASIYARGVGDFNHDGLSDVIVRMPREVLPSASKYDAAESQLIFGRKQAFPPSVNADLLSPGRGTRLWGEAIDCQFDPHRSQSPAGDVNGDGIDDLIIGTNSDYYGGREGKAYVVFGSDAIFEDGGEERPSLNRSRRCQFDK